MRMVKQDDLGFEPTLHEALADPVIQAVMRRDGVTREDIVHLAEAARARLLGEGVVTAFPARTADCAVDPHPDRAADVVVRVADEPDMRPRTRWPFSVRPVEVP